MRGARLDEVRGALRLLDVRRLALAVHDPSLPGDDDEDTGHGAPASRGALRFLAFVAALGFDAVQLGPQGLLSEGNFSPYDGAAFSRSTLSIDLGRLAHDAGWLGLLPAERLAALLAGRPAGAEGRVPYPFVQRVQREALGLAFAAFEQRLARGEPAVRELADAIARFAAREVYWLEPDSLFEAASLSGAGAAAGPEDAPVLRARFAPLLAFYRFQQFVAADQHRELRDAVRRLGLALLGDLPIGIAPRDVWSRPGLLLRGYRLGAPPSRTNLEGQPWGYPVLDPSAYGSREAPGPALRFVQERVARLLEDCDGVRIDHPHGLVCPWVYREDVADPLRAVQTGARLFSSPNLPEHPELGRFALVEPEQLAGPGTPRYADDWVRELDEEQVERYAVLFDAVVDAVHAAGCEPTALACEVLSTLPRPLDLVRRRHGLGRFRVTQKASPADPDDVYRPERAEPEDWIMLGNHDTPSIWEVVEGWARAGELPARARYLAGLLEPDAARRAAWAEDVARDPGLLVQAEFASLLASRARHVSVFFADLLGMRERYNLPGSVSDENWTLRVPRDYAGRYAEGLARGRALDLPQALALALRARPDTGEAGRNLATRLAAGTDGAEAASAPLSGAAGGTARS